MKWIKVDSSLDFETFQLIEESWAEIIFIVKSCHEGLYTIIREDPINISSHVTYKEDIEELYKIKLSI